MRQEPHTFYSNCCYWGRAMQRAAFSCSMKLSSPSVSRLHIQSTWSIKALKTIILLYCAAEENLQISPVLRSVEEVSCIEHGSFLSGAGYFPMSGHVTGVHMVYWASELVSAGMIGVKSSHETGSTASGHYRVLVLWLQLRLVSVKRVWMDKDSQTCTRRLVSPSKNQKGYITAGFFLGMALAKCEWNTPRHLHTIINQATLFCNAVKSAEYIHAKKCSLH